MPLTELSCEFWIQILKSTRSWPSYLSDRSWTHSGLQTQSARKLWSCLRTRRRDLGSKEALTRGPSHPVNALKRFEPLMLLPQSARRIARFFDFMLCQSTIPDELRSLFTLQLVSFVHSRQMTLLPHLKFPLEWYWQTFRTLILISFVRFCLCFLQWAFLLRPELPGQNLRTGCRLNLER